MSTEQTKVAEARVAAVKDASNDTKDNRPGPSTVEVVARVAAAVYTVGVSEIAARYVLDKPREEAQNAYDKEYETASKRFEEKDVREAYQSVNEDNKKSSNRN